MLITQLFIVVIVLLFFKVSRSVIQLQKICLFTILSFKLTKHVDPIWLLISGNLRCELLNMLSCCRWTEPEQAFFSPNTKLNCLTFSAQTWEWYRFSHLSEQKRNFTYFPKCQKVFTKCHIELWITCKWEGRHESDTGDDSKLRVLTNDSHISCPQALHVMVALDSCLLRLLLVELLSLCL